jgi:hypothetical protein
MAPRKKRNKTFDIHAETRAIARERVGAVKPARPITPKTKKPPKHKPSLDTAD